MWSLPIQPKQAITKKYFFVKHIRMMNLPLNKLKQIAKSRSIKTIKTNLNWWSETDEDHYKPIKTKSAFNANYIEYESKGVKDKNLSPREYLDIVIFKQYDKWS